MFSLNVLVFPFRWYFLESNGYLPLMLKYIVCKRISITIRVIELALMVGVYTDCFELQPDTSLRVSRNWNELLLRYDQVWRPNNQFSFCCSVKS